MRRQLRAELDGPTRHAPRPSVLLASARLLPPTPPPVRSALTLSLVAQLATVALLWRQLQTVELQPVELQPGARLDPPPPAALGPPQPAAPSSAEPGRAASTSRPAAQANGLPAAATPPAPPQHTASTSRSTAQADGPPSASDVLWFVLSVFNTLLGFGTVATAYGGEYLVPVDRCRGESRTRIALRSRTCHEALVVGV